MRRFGTAEDVDRGTGEVSGPRIGRRATVAAPCICPKERRSNRAGPEPLKLITWRKAAMVRLPLAVFVQEEGMYPRYPVP